jgi:two-component system, NtrC family, sensor histidine kinase HydH
MFSIGVSLLLVIAVGTIGLVRDFQSVRRSVYSAEINEARSHAERTVGRIESELLEGVQLETYRNTHKTNWLADHWQRTIPGKPDRLYAALVDLDENILAHSDELTGMFSGNRKLNSDWSSTPLIGFGSGVHLVQPNSLTSLDAIDISSEINLHGKKVGSYHAGIERRWLELLVTEAQRDTLKGWTFVIAAVGAIVFGSSLLLYRLGIHTRRLEQALEEAETKRLAGLSRLIVGMAHELRDPLNAVRLNLFTTEKVVLGAAELPKDEVVGMIHESVQEVERVEDLMDQLLGYARVHGPSQGACNAVTEIKAILLFLKRIHEKYGIEVTFLSGCEELVVGLEGKLLRQVLLNLLNNAREAIGHDGKIEISIQESDADVSILIDDSGAGMPTDLYERIFEPFYTTRADGVGLGLAVVNSIVDGVSGTVRCRRSWTLGGMTFEVTLPRSSLQLEQNREHE